ncbi:MAG: hypothetical protein JWO40_793 [Candidatus Doudnabacteria bacterium]|nr:hypothetical protein [Candidatus Doudnabacteria bacterium]
MNLEISEYVRQAREAGVNDHEIKLTLLEAGWKHEDIDQAIGIPKPTPTAQDSVMAAAIVPHVIPVAKKRFSGKVFVIAAIIVIILAGGGYVAYAKLMPMIAFAQFAKAPASALSSTSNHFELSITGTVTQNSKDQGYTFNLKGDSDKSDLNNPQGQFFLSLSSNALGADISVKDIEAREVNKKEYINISQIPFVGDSAKDYGGWIVFNIADLQKQLTSSSTDVDWKKGFENVDYSKVFAEHTYIGKENVNEFSSYHYSLKIDKAVLAEVISQVVENLYPKDDKAANLKAMNDAFKDLNFDKFDIWIGSSDKQLHKILVTTNINVAATDYSSASSVKSEVSLILTPGAKLNLKAPDKALDYTQLFGGVASSANSGGNADSSGLDPISEARFNATSAKALADARELSTALELDYNDYSAYPPRLNMMVPTYVGAIPEFQKINTPACAAITDYNYNLVNNGKSYSFEFCLGVATGGLAAGVHTVTSEGIQ